MTRTRSGYIPAAASIVEPRQVFKTAILVNAAAIICLHNHPFSNPEPSREDIRITRQLVVEIVELSKLEHGDRIEKAGCDFFAGVPAGGDAYILKHIIHDWSDEHAITILRRVREAIADDGRLLVMEMVLSDESPPFAPWLDVQMLVMVDGKERTEAEFATLLDEAGFRLNRVVATKCPVSIIEGLPVSG